MRGADYVSVQILCASLREQGFARQARRIVKVRIPQLSSATRTLQYVQGSLHTRPLANVSPR